MRVDAILKSKPAAEVATIGPEATLAGAAAVLAERGIGALVVSEDGAGVQGMLSERDLVRELAARGGDCLNRTVSEVMTSDISTAAPQDQADEILNRMTQGRFRHMPVMAEGRMIGLISIGDVVKARLDELDFEKRSLEGMISGH